MSADQDPLLDYCRRRTEHARKVLAGLPSSDSVQAIIADHRATFAPDQVRAALDAAHGADADQRRRRALVLLDGAIEARTARQIDDLDAWEQRATVSVSGVDRSPRDVAALLRRGPAHLDPGKRRRLAAAHEEAVDQSAGLRTDLWEKRAEAAQALAGCSYSDAYAALLPLDLSQLAAAATKILQQTEETFEAGRARHVPVSLGRSTDDCRLAWSDVPHLMAGPQWNKLFADRSVDLEVERVLQWSIGDHCGREGIIVDLADRAQKTSRPFCAAVQVPGEIHLVARPHGSHRDWEELYHEIGHVVHFVHAPADLPWEFRYLPWDPVAEAHAFWMASLLREPGYLVDQLGLPANEARDYAAFATFIELFMVRAYCARVLIEIDFHTAGPASLSSYPSRMMDAVRVRYPASWALLELDGGLAGAQYLQAWMLWGDMHQHLVYAGAPASNRPAAHLDFMRSLWRSCAGDTPVSLASRLGLPSSDPGRLIRALAQDPLYA